MKERDEFTGDPNERLDPRLHADLARAGWTMPESESEVRAAEEWARNVPGELPARLRDTPEIGAPERSSREDSGILSRHLRDEGRTSSSPNDEKSRDSDQRDVEPER
jgi:hypothetical protein